MNPIQHWRELPWALWRRQTMAVINLELRKCFLGKRLIAVYFLAFGPVLLMALAAGLMLATGRHPNPLEVTQGISVFFQVFLLRICVFFGCAAIFTNIFRGEVLEKTLHYYFLSAIRREVLVVGKFLAGLCAACFFFGFSVFCCFVLIHLPLGGGFLTRFFGNGPGLGHLAGYLAAAGLGCLGYGAIFTLFGLLFRNPVFPALTLFGLESVNFLLPPLLKKFSVVFYLQSLSPVPLDQGPLAVLAKPVPPLAAAACLTGLALAALVAAALAIRRLEISYAAD